MRVRPSGFFVPGRRRLRPFRSFRSCRSCRRLRLSFLSFLSFRRPRCLRRSPKRASFRLLFIVVKGLFHEKALHAIYHECALMRVILL